MSPAGAIIQVNAVCACARSTNSPEEGYEEEKEEDEEEEEEMEKENDHDVGGRMSGQFKAKVSLIF